MEEEEEEDTTTGSEETDVIHSTEDRRGSVMR